MKTIIKVEDCGGYATFNTLMASIFVNNTFSIYGFAVNLAKMAMPDIVSEDHARAQQAIAVATKIFREATEERIKAEVFAGAHDDSDIDYQELFLEFVETAIEDSKIAN